MQSGHGKWSIMSFNLKVIEHEKSIFRETDGDKREPGRDLRVGWLR